MKKVARTVQLSRAVALRIERLAAAGRRSQSAICAELLDEALDQKRPDCDRAVVIRQEFPKWPVYVIFAAGLAAAFLAGMAV